MADDDSRAGKRYGTEQVAQWTHDVHAKDDEALARAFATPAGVPRIMVGPSDGKSLYVFLKLLGARKVVEVGTLVAYSTIHMARALAGDGHLWTIEADPNHAKIARSNLAAAGLAERVTVELGLAREVLPRLVEHGPFDAVFIDADKINYPHYGAWAITNLRRGGLVLGDNAYLFGRLLEDNPEGQAMRDFHQHVAATCDSVCIQSPEGLLVGIKR